MSSTLTAETTVVARPEPISTTLDGEEVILHTETGTYHGLNEVGSEIWDRIQRPVTVGDLVSSIATTYDQDVQQVETDVHSFIHELTAADLARVDDP